MDLYDFFNTFLSALAADAELEAWAQANFSKSVTVYGDLSSNDLPAVADMPYVILHTPQAAKSQQRDVREYALAVDMALNKDALATRAEGNVELPGGVELALDMATLAVAAVKDALPNDNILMGYNLAADTLGMLPEVHLYMDFEFSEEITLGTDPLG